jgi:hypothetical protein
MVEEGRGYFSYTSNGRREILRKLNSTSLQSHLSPPSLTPENRLRSRSFFSLFLSITLAHPRSTSPEHSLTSKHFRSLDQLFQGLCSNCFELILLDFSIVKNALFILLEQLALFLKHSKTKTLYKRSYSSLYYPS